ncbi:YrhK family protein [Marinococcus sp. PL1-022]|uniref:YrhK family protein n=1 Tax=Marinococcus sp. PL1-022 TaxID=3095363 RepID=UPI0029C49E22|nr:YrhK family protein [Marinococcus sp. PL1-022]MDX6152808.1 YrhK family protein [Marinococcus sp. PL1-022]
MNAEQAANQSSQDYSSRNEYIESRMKNHTPFFKKIYNTLYTINDFLLGLWFFIGSICFYFEGPWRILGVTLFVVASFQFLIRPSIRLIHEFHARRHYGREYDRKFGTEKQQS